MEQFKKIYLKFLDTSQIILFIISIFLGLYIAVVKPHEVSGSSMFPTFKDKEFLLSYLIDVHLKSIRRGDVIVFHSPVEADKLYIKRVIGIPGDTVKVLDAAVFLNGQKLNESSYIDGSVATYGGSFLHDGEEVSVPEGTFFVMGDNRPYSSDSREWGFLPYDKLIGRSVVRVWPPNTFSIIGRDPYNN